MVCSNDTSQAKQQNKPKLQKEGGKMFIRVVVYICLIGILCANLVQSKKLNYPRLLLPIFDGFSVNFTLEIIEKGCVTWKTSRPDLLRVTPLYDDECSYRAVVTPITREKTRNTPLVLAEEVTSSGIDILRCDVILDVITSFEVITTTRELYLQEAPEKFELMAHDALGNAFSSLEGVEFQWEIKQNDRNSKADGHWTEIMRFLKFSESTYHEVPESMSVLENQDVTGYMILLEGSNTGMAKVSVRLPYSEYRHVDSVEVDIMVLANILIDPSDVSILVGDTTKYRILQLTQGKVTDISSNSQYFLEVEKSAIARLSNNVATGLAIGRTLVQLKDKNVAEEQEHSALNPKATLNVVTPVKLVVDLLPHYNWITLEGQSHEIVFTLLTSEDQRITLGVKFHVTGKIDGDYFRVDSVVKNGTHNAGQAIKMGTSLVSGRFEGLTTKAELMIYKRLSLTPRRVILPFDPMQNFKPNRVQFLADGGDGNFIWSSDNKNFVAINKNGLAESRLTDVSAGENNSLSRKAQIKVALARNPKLFETAEILFLEPVKLQIASYNFETALDDVIKVHLALFAQDNQGKSIPFTDCSNLKFENEFTDNLFVPVVGDSNITMANDACQLMVLRATNVGKTHLKVSYRYLERVLSDSVQLVVFERLDLLHPVVDELVLPIGSSQNVIFTNGPQRLFNIDAELKKTVDFAKAVLGVSEVSVPNPNSQGLNVLNVLCRKIGQSDLRLTMTNVLQTRKIYNPYLSEYTLRVFCVKPRFLNLISREKVHDGCPMNSKINSVVEINGEDAENEFIEIEIEISDVDNRKLSNISSLQLDWKLLEGKDTVQNFNYLETSEEKLVEGIAVPNTFLLKLNRNLKTDMKTNFKLIGTVVGYDDSVLSTVDTTPDVPPFGIQKTPSSPLKTPTIESELNFMAINATLLPVDRLSLFWKSPRRLPILQGSGYYEIIVDDTSKIRAELDRQKNEILITPFEIGDTVLTLVDRCLSSLKHEVIVSVVSISKIELRVSDRVEKSKSIEAIARLKASNNDYLDLDYSRLDVYDLSVDIIDRNVLKMDLLSEQRNVGKGEIRFKVTGLENGETKVSVSSGKFVSSSPPNSVNVFLPLELFPKNSSILVGTTLQIQSRGGPQSEIGVEFEAQDEKIVQMDSSVVLGLKLGKTKIVGRCVGFDPTTGSAVSFSEDSVIVNVVPLDGVKIVAPLTRMKRGAVMPASIWAIPNIPPSVLGTLQNLKIYWSTSHPDILEISNIFSAIGVEYLETDLISVRVKALKAGKATLSAKTVTPNGRVLQSSVEVSVLNELELEKPKAMSSSSTLITMPPNSDVQLKTNDDATTYKLQNTGSGRSLINVTDTGLVKSGDEIGFAFIMASSALDQQLPVLVRVKNIHYILTSLSIDSVQPPNLRMMESRIPRGLTLKLKISFHDNVGNEVLHNWDGSEHLKFGLSRRDALSVHISSDFQLTVSLSQETSNILAVGLRGLKSTVKYAEDFVKISVYPSDNIYPSTNQEVFTAGDIICFDSIIPQPARWISDSPAVHINERTGLAFVQDSGATTPHKVDIYHENSVTGLSIKFECDIRNVDVVDFVKPSDSFNGLGEYRAYFVLKNRLQGRKLSNLIARNVTRCTTSLTQPDLKLFACEILRNSNVDAALTQKIKVTEGFEVKTGQYYCAMSLVDFEKDWRVYLGRNNFLVGLEVKLKSGVMATSEIKVVTGVIVEPSKLTLASEDDTKELIVYGRESYLKGLQLVASQKNLEVKKLSMSAIEADGEQQFAIKYQVKLVGLIDESDILTIAVQSALTEQNLTIPVDVNADRKCSVRPSASSNFLSSIVANFGLIISTIVVLSVVLYVALPITSKVQSNPQVFQNSSSKLNGSNPSFAQSTLSTSSPASQLNLTFNTSADPVYGDSGQQISPHRRVNRRFL